MLVWGVRVYHTDLTCADKLQVQDQVLRLETLVGSLAYFESLTESELGFYG